jgi:hypothetical protein
LPASTTDQRVCVIDDCGQPADAFVTTHHNPRADRTNSTGGTVATRVMARHR